jgi:hypothetical protein
MELNQYEKKVFSQNGEDGIIAEICNRISLPSDYFVEFGVETGIQCNCRQLALNGWKGLMIEGSPDMFGQLINNYRDYDVNLVHSFITAENIVSTFERNDVPKQLGLLSVDIDGNDYWVLKEILLAQYRPYILIAEYNAYHEPPVEWIMKYNPNHTWDGTSYQGVSLQSLTKLCNKFEYGLVATDNAGVNAFYVRRDIIENYNLTELTSIEAYHPARYFGHMNNGEYGHPFKDGEFVKE